MDRTGFYLMHCRRWRYFPFRLAEEGITLSYQFLTKLAVLASIVVILALTAVILLLRKKKIKKFLKITLSL